jgi:hypothetical protein
MRVAPSTTTLAAAYVTGHTYLGIAASDPGTTPTPASEASGGSPAYSRVAVAGGWTPGSPGVQTAALTTLNLPAGTWAWMLLFSSATGNNMWDNCTLTPTILTADGPLIITPTVTVV